MGEDRMEYLTTVNGDVTATADDIAVPYASLPVVPVTRLSALDRLFEATGVATVRVGTRLLEVPIQSVDLEQVEALCKPFRPRVPVKRDQIGGRWVTIMDEANEQYREALQHYNFIYAHVNACCGLCVDVVADDGTVVWSADNRVHDIERAIKALKAQGLVLNHLASINRAINALTTYEEEQQLGE